jgi:hypothetical protein
MFDSVRCAQKKKPARGLVSVRVVGDGGEGGIAFGVPEGWEPAATTRIELENPPACAGAVFLCPKLTEIHFDAPRA